MQFSAQYTEKIMAEYRSSGKELRKSPKGLIAGILTVGLLAGGVYAVQRVMSGMQTLVPTEDERSADHEVVIPGTTEPADPSKIQYEYRDIYRSDIGRGDLVLVNADHPISNLEYGLVNVYESKNEFLWVKDMEIQLQRSAMDALNDMATDFQRETGHADLMVMNGYRTYEEQQRLYENDLQRTGGSTSTLYAIPGCDEFESGLAFDLNIYQNGNARAFNDEGDYAWITEHCAEYGFILRYPEEKEYLTKVKDKPFVFRYVGPAHAMNMAKQEMCMEEYMLFMEEFTFDYEPHFVLRDAEGKRYECYYIPAGDDETAEMASVPVPTTLHFAVSGDNRNGFFVTAELPASDESSTAVITWAKTVPYTTETTTVQ